MVFQRRWALSGQIEINLGVFGFRKGVVLWGWLHRRSWKCFSVSKIFWGALIGHMQQVFGVFEVMSALQLELPEDPTVGFWFFCTSVGLECFRAIHGTKPLEVSHVLRDGYGSKKLSKKPYQIKEKSTQLLSYLWAPLGLASFDPKPDDFWSSLMETKPMRAQVQCAPRRSASCLRKPKQSLKKSSSFLPKQWWIHLNSLSP